MRVFFLGILFCHAATALDVDEKLTIRILDVSDTKKTILLNRGLEDGLVLGNHAKFYLTTGVFARGVLVKASPGRSIWMIYRMIDSKHMEKDQVAKIKIATAVKLTKDPTRSINPDETVNAISDAIPLAEDANDLGKLLMKKNKENLSSASDKGMLMERWELWGQLNFNGLSYSSSTDENNARGDSSIFDFSFGGEMYLNQSSNFFKNISLLALVHYHQMETGDVAGNSTSLNGMEFGLGLNYYFLENSMAYGDMIPFGTMAIGMGSTEEISEGTPDGESISGSNSFFIIGAGLKYHLANGFGGRVVLDYYSRSEVYSFDDGDWTKNVSGLRVMLGLSYRL